MSNDAAVLKKLEDIEEKVDRMDTALRGDQDHLGLVARVTLIETEVERGPRLLKQTIAVVSLVVTVLLGIFALIIKS